jgi:ABC-type branched-subunit amino acid transport system ATPase component
MKMPFRAIEHMQLKAYAEEISSSYSGGNKRKLSAAIALVRGKQNGKICLTLYFIGGGSPSSFAGISLF